MRAALSALQEQGVRYVVLDALNEQHLLTQGEALRDMRLVTGDRWSSAIGSVEWTPTDLLVVGSSRIGHVARVFLGSTATKILRHTPVPVLVVPTGTATWVA